MLTAIATAIEQKHPGDAFRRLTFGERFEMTHKGRNADSGREKDERPGPGQRWSEAAARRLDPDFIADTQTMDMLRKRTRIVGEPEIVGALLLYRDRQDIPAVMAGQRIGAGNVDSRQAQ